MSEFEEMVLVSSKRHGKSVLQPLAGFTIYDVDRSNPVLGNRHILRNPLDENERADVIAAAAKDLREDEARCGPMTQELSALAARVFNGEKIALRCWCAPKPCHADLFCQKIIEIATTMSGNKIK